VNWKYLAFVAILAGWIWFCFWLYADGKWPFKAGIQESAGIQVMEDLGFPLAFLWGSAVPLAGRSFDEWKRPLSGMDSLGYYMIWRGHYYQDEAGNEAGRLQLANSRVRKVIEALGLPDSMIVVELVSQDITSDVRSKPFMAVNFEILKGKDVAFFNGDTAQICFPLRDSLLLPEDALQQLMRWAREADLRDPDTVHLVGTADGTGISESSDVAMDRAAWVRQVLIRQGHDSTTLQISGGQRNHPHTLLNRCVLMYLEKYE
jgi:hypothetical protein